MCTRCWLCVSREELGAALALPLSMAAPLVYVCLRHHPGVTRLKPVDEKPKPNNE